MSNHQTIYPLGLDRLQWAERRELVMTMREARGISQFAARMIGCSTSRVRSLLRKLKVDADEYDGEPFGQELNEHNDAAREAIERALECSGGNKLRAARSLGIGRQTLYNRMAKLEISLDA